jgi:hypothetical protein
VRRGQADRDVRRRARVEGAAGTVGNHRPQPVAVGGEGELGQGLPPAHHGPIGFGTEAVDYLESFRVVA